MYKYYKLKRFFDAEKDAGGTPKEGNDGGEESEGKETKLDPTITVAQSKANAKAAADKAVSDLLSTLGIEDTDTLASTVKAAKEAQEAGKTELQRLTDQVATLTETVSSNEEALNQRDITIEALTIDNAIIQVAGSYGFHNVADDVLPKAREMLTINDDGRVEGVTEVLDKIKENYPHYVATHTGTQTKGDKKSPKSRSVTTFEKIKVPRM